jgi:hypothetical protein
VQIRVQGASVADVEVGQLSKEVVEQSKFDAECPESRCGPHSNQVAPMDVDARTVQHLQCAGPVLALARSAALDQTAITLESGDEQGELMARNQDGAGPPGSLFSWASASGKSIPISDEALKRGRALFAEDFQQEYCADAEVQGAGDQRAGQSRRAAAPGLLLGSHGPCKDGEDEHTPAMPQQSGLWTTGSGRPVHVSEHSLTKARAVLGGLLLAPLQPLEHPQSLGEQQGSGKGGSSVGAAVADAGELVRDCTMHDGDGRGGASSRLVPGEDPDGTGQREGRPCEAESGPTSAGVPQNAQAGALHKQVGSSTLQNTGCPRLPPCSPAAPPAADTPQQQRQQQEHPPTGPGFRLSASLSAMRSGPASAPKTGVSGMRRPPSSGPLRTSGRGGRGFKAPRKFLTPIRKFALQEVRWTPHI